MESDAGTGALVALAMVVTASLGLPEVVAAQRRASTISISRARSYFDEMGRAWHELRALDVEPADANGAIAGWDRVWSRRVDRVERATRHACLEIIGGSGDCNVHERAALICGAAFDVSTHRAVIFDEVPEPSVDPFEARRAIADEASRRRVAGLSCEGLPSHMEIEGSAASGWVRYDGRPLVAPPPDTSGVPDASRPSDGGRDDAAIGAIVERERPSLTRCWEAAVRGISPTPSVHLDVSLAIGASGIVTSVVVSGDGIGTLVPCIERTAHRWRFREGSVASATSFSVAFGEPPDAGVP